MRTVIYNFINESQYEYSNGIVVENGVVRLKYPYSMTGEYVKSKNKLNIDVLVKLDIDAVLNKYDEISFTLEIDGVEYWWDGAAWVVSSSPEESNYYDEITAYARFLEILSNTKEFRLVTYLWSFDGSTTPTLDNLILEFISYANVVEESHRVKVWGYISCIDGSFAKGVSIKVSLISPVIYNNIIISPMVLKTVSVDNGYFELYVIDNEGMSFLNNYGIGKPYYIFEFRGRGIDNIVEYKYVPRVDSVEYVKLENVVPGGIINGKVE